MLKAKVHDIRSNDHLMDDFMRYEPDDPWDEFGWFGVDVGTSCMGGQDYFQCLVTTTRARHRAVSGLKDSRCFVVDPYEPKGILDALTEKINGVEGVEWCNIVDRLREFMHWEYDGMDGSSTQYFPSRPS